MICGVVCVFKFLETPFHPFPGHNPPGVGGGGGGGVLVVEMGPQNVPPHFPLVLAQTSHVFGHKSSYVKGTWDVQEAHKCIMTRKR